MLNVFKIIQLLVLLLCFAGSIGGKDERMNRTCYELYKVSGLLFLASELITQIIRIIN